MSLHCYLVVFQETYDTLVNAQFDDEPTSEKVEGQAYGVQKKKRERKQQ